MNEMKRNGTCTTKQPAEEGGGGGGVIQTVLVLGESYDIRPIFVGYFHGIQSISFQNTSKIHKYNENLTKIHQKYISNCIDLFLSYF